VESVEDILLGLASRIEPDGGMPGGDRESRASATVVALLAFLSQGHTRKRGAFRSHVAKLEWYLKLLTGVSSHTQQVLAAVLELVRLDLTLPGDWMELVRTPGNHLHEVERRMKELR